MPLLNRVSAARHKSPTEDAIQSLLDDRETVFWVDWREDDDAIVDYCEDILNTRSLSAHLVDAENEAGFELFIHYKDRRVRVPLVIGHEDRHLTIVSLNDILAPDFEIRFCIDSNNADTLAFLPLATDAWRDLESQFGENVARRFYRIKPKPNLFTDELPF